MDSWTHDVGSSTELAVWRRTRKRIRKRNGRRMGEESLCKWAEMR